MARDSFVGHEYFGRGNAQAASHRYLGILFILPYSPYLLYLFAG